MNKLKELKNRGSERAKILAWLDSINAPQDEVDEVIEMCRTDIECRKYYVGKYDEIK